MSSSNLRVSWPTAARFGAPALPSQAALWRTSLLLACALAVGFAAWCGSGGDSQADPALAHLLRAMALIKGLMVLGVMGVALWRYRWPIAAPVAIGYAAGVAMMAGSTMLIWQLTRIPPAALMFHAALSGVLYLSWREGSWGKGGWRQS